MPNSLLECFIHTGEFQFDRTYPILKRIPPVRPLQPISRFSNKLASLQRLHILSHGVRAKNRSELSLKGAQTDTVPFLLVWNMEKDKHATWWPNRKPLAKLQSLANASWVQLDSDQIANPLRERQFPLSDQLLCSEPADHWINQLMLFREFVCQSAPPEFPALMSAAT